MLYDICQLMDFWVVSLFFFAVVNNSAMNFHTIFFFLFHFHAVLLNMGLSPAFCSASSHFPSFLFIPSFGILFTMTQIGISGPEMGR